MINFNKGEIHKRIWKIMGNNVSLDYNAVDWNDFLEYNEESKTHLFWKKDTPLREGAVNYKRKVGNEAGWIDKYVTLELNDSNYRVHRIIWIMHNGFLDPRLDVDHIDGNRLNNNIRNLRAVTHEVNVRNSRMCKNNTTGITGVSFAKRIRKAGVYTVVTAYWQEYVDGVSIRKSKDFSVNMYGLLPAYAMAVEHRLNKIQELNNLGYNYSSTHGL